MAWRGSLFPLLVLSVSVVSCGEDRGSSDGCTTADCRSGVAIDLGKPAERYASSLPLAVHVCFDASCDDVTLASGRGGVTCGGIPGVGAPDQLTACFVDENGAVSIEIGRTDGRAYDSATPHTIAVSFVDGAGTVVHEEVKSIHLEDVHPNGASCGPVCYQSQLSLE